MAYVLVQHLSPSHESALTEILQRVSEIPVYEITDNVEIERDTIYVIPSNKIITTTDGILKLSSRDSVKTSLIIDVFFNSLAVVRDSFAIGVILSGSGSDGTVGLKMIREYGGITVAQDQDSAAFGDMPLSAVNAGVVDFVLPPEKIPEHLIQINRASHTVPANKQKREDIAKDDEAVFKKILILLQQHSGVDFIYYKQNTIRRRIARRMALHKKLKLEDYWAFLRTDKGEVDALFQDMLIPVTSFFRDPDTLETLCKSIFPELFKKKSLDEPIRMWIAGCSTGEEAYSLAICLNEFLGKRALGMKIRIFASDISEKAIKKARTGIYSKEEVQKVSQERLVKYFTKTQGSYMVNKAIREICVFAVHNLLRDPPFAKMDFISCRNVFIYLDTFLQKKALRMFHYSLNENGILLLGKSETIGAAPEYFTHINNSDKIFSRKPVPGRFMHVATQGSENSFIEQNKFEKSSDSTGVDFRKSAEAVMISKSPASVIVNGQMEIVHFHGDITPFLRPSPGKPTFNIFKMAREGISFELRNILHKAKSKTTALQEEITLTTDGRQSLISIEVSPLPDMAEPYFLIFFKETLLEQKIQKSNENGDLNNEGQRIQELEGELTQLRLDMRTITEEHDSANEELQSMNEELQSSNEELQSLNEELETSKEELQSANEELIISNQELLDKQGQLDAAWHYSEAIVKTIREPLLVLDKRLTIKSANASYYNKFNTREEDIEDRYFFEIQDKVWNNSQLREWLQDVLPNKYKKEDFDITLQLSNGSSSFILSAQQIDNDRNEEELILLAFEDVTHSVMNKRLQQSESRFRQLTEQIPHLVFTADSEGKVNYVNKEMLDYTGKTFEELEGEGWFCVVSPSAHNRTIAKWKEGLKKEQKVFLELNVRKHDETDHWHLVHAVPQKDNQGTIILWIGTFTNIQDQKDFSEALEEKVRERTSELEKTNHQLNQFAYTASHDLQEPLRKIKTFANMLKGMVGIELPDKVNTYLGKIESSSTRMSNLIQDLLNFSKVSNARDLFQQTDLNSILNNILSDFEILIEEKNAKINSEKLPVIQAIPFQMNQLFYNLVSNALKFSREKESPELTITSHQLTEEQAQKYSSLNQELTYHQLIFKDNGIGFSQEYAQQIFIIFQRLNQPAKYSGTGIGLALSKKIVEAHKGVIFALSHENEGAEFHIILPAKQ